MLAIQGDTTAAVTAIEEISTIVAQISDRQTTIASAVEEQTATTNEMSRSVQEAAGGTTEIATNITGVSTAADATTQALTQTRTAVDELSRMAADLRGSGRPLHLLSHRGVGRRAGRRDRARSAPGSFYADSEKRHVDIHGLVDQW